MCKHLGLLKIRETKVLVGNLMYAKEMPEATSRLSR